MSTDSHSYTKESDISNNIALEWAIIKSLKLTGRINYRLFSDNQKDVTTDFVATPLHIYGPIQFQNIVSESNHLTL